MHSHPLGLIAQSKLRPRERGAKCQPLEKSLQMQDRKAICPPRSAWQVLSVSEPFSLLQPNTRHKAIRGMAYFGSRVGGIVCHGDRGCEAAGHIAPTVRRQRDESPCLARFLFTQSRAPVHGRVPPTFQVGLPLKLRQSRKPLRHAQRCASGDCRLRQEDDTKQLHSWQIRIQSDSQISRVGPGQMVEETHQGLSSLSTQSVFI